MKRCTILSFMIGLQAAFAWGQPTIVLEELQLSGPNLVNPVDLTGSGDGSGRIFVVEQRGTIRIVENGAVQSGYFLDIQSNLISSSGERGLLGLTFHPDFPATPYFYVNYVGGSNTTIISRFTVNPADPDDALENSEDTLLTVVQPATNHNAGDLAFSPVDWYLYIPLGDGGGSNDQFENGQDSSSLLGKLLRIDVDNGDPYAIPPSNPYIGYPNVPDEIWAFGLRNPWRISFDRATGDLWIGDVGQGEWEEIDYQPADSPGGHNYGWNCYEGPDSFDPEDCEPESAYDAPVFAYSPDCPPNPCTYGTGNCVIGGFVYRGSDYPDLQGYYVCVDYGSENMWTLHADGGLEITPQDAALPLERLSSFGEDDNGELYVLSLESDAIYRVGTDANLPVYFTRLDIAPREEVMSISWEVESSGDVRAFHIQRIGHPGGEFENIGDIAGEYHRHHYTYNDTEPVAGKSFYRIRATLKNGSEEYSNIAAAYFHGPQQEIIVETAHSGELVIYSARTVDEVTITVYLANGALVSSITTQLLDETFVAGTGLLNPGPYFVVVRDSDTVLAAEKWIKVE